MDGSVIILLKWEKTRAISHGVIERDDYFRQTEWLLCNVRWRDAQIHCGASEIVHCSLARPPDKGTKEIVQYSYLSSLKT